MERPGSVSGDVIGVDKRREPSVSGIRVSNPHPTLRPDGRRFQTPEQVFHYYGRMTVSDPNRKTEEVYGGDRWVIVSSDTRLKGTRTGTRGQWTSRKDG